ncbi:cadherin-like domain-containing protein, partial [Vibrio crassostreae]
IDVEYSDGTDTNTVTHTVNFAPVNDGPVATDPTDTLINDNESITYTEAELLANASDIDGETLSVTNVAYAGTDGTLVDNGDDTWTFTPNNAF